MPSKPTISRLPSGLTVASIPMPHRTSVSLGIWVAAGGRHEPAHLNGASHFIEHMLFKGTRRRTAGQISETVEGLGGTLDASTGEENTCFHARAGHQHLDTLAEVIIDMLLHSRFSPADVAKERAVIKEEWAMYRDQPQQHVHELLNACLWPDQPLGRPLTGTPDSLDRLNRATLLRFLHQHYTAGACTVVAAGHVSHAQLLRAIAPLNRHLPPGPPPPPAATTENQSRPRIYLDTRNVEQTQLALGFRACSRHDPRRFALRLLNTLLGDNMSSRLFQAVREDRGLAYDIHSSASHFEDTGDLVISAGLDTDNLHQTLRLILAELRRLTTTLASITELRRARDYILGQMDLSLEHAESQMHWAGDQLTGHGRLFHPNSIRRHVRAVTPTQIRSVARDFFRPDRLNLALVSPLKSTRTLVPLLRL